MLWQICDQRLLTEKETDYWQIRSSYGDVAQEPSTTQAAPDEEFMHSHLNRQGLPLKREVPLELLWVCVEGNCKRA